MPVCKVGDRVIDLDNFNRPSTVRAVAKDGTLTLQWDEPNGMGDDFINGIDPKQVKPLG